MSSEDFEYLEIDDQVGFALFRSDVEGVRCAGRGVWNERRLSRSLTETASHRGKARRQGERGVGANGAINSKEKSTFK